MPLCGVTLNNDSMTLSLLSTVNKVLIRSFLLFLCYWTQSCKTRVAKKNPKTVLKTGLKMKETTYSLVFVK
jgi:hypothetical protein